MLIQDHLGHNLGISEKISRKSLPLIELTKVAKALVLAQQGEIFDYNGKYFEELTAEDVEPEDDEDIEEIEENNESDEDHDQPPPKYVN